MEIDQQNYNSGDGIRFCRWLDAFPNEQFDNQAADKDRDRFRIKIGGNIPNLTKARIQVTDLHGAVIDGQFVNKTTDGDYEIEMKSEGDSMVSTPILLAVGEGRAAAGAPEAAASPYAHGRGERVIWAPRTSRAHPGLRAVSGRLLSPVRVVFARQASLGHGLPALLPPGTTFPCRIGPDHYRLRSLFCAAS